MNKLIIEQVPPNYYFEGTKSNPFQKYWHQKKWKILSEFLDNAEGKLLDIGCADRTTTSKIKEDNSKLIATGVDCYLGSISFAKKTQPSVSFVCGDVHRMPFKIRRLVM